MAEAQGHRLMRSERRKRVIESRQAAKEGRRFHAFYCGVRDWRAGRRQNRFPPGSEQAQCWANGQKYMEDDK